MKQEEEKKQKPGIANIRHIIAIASGKGGVGKSTVTTNLANALTQRGYRVGVLDADLYGPSQPMMLGKDEKARAQDGYAIPIVNRGVKFISLNAVSPDSGAAIMRGPIAVKILQQFLGSVLWGELDFLLIDLPPGTGDIQLTLSQQARLTGGIVVTTPQKVAQQISSKAIDMFQKLQIPVLGIVENMSGFTCNHCGSVTEIFKRGGGHDVAKACSIPFLGALPLDPAVMMSADEGQSLFDLPADHALRIHLEAIVTRFEEELHQVSSGEQSIEPAKIEIYQDTGRLHIHWNNQTQDSYDAYQLRLLCPCASCVDELSRKPILNIEAVPLDIKVSKVMTVGRYGLSIHFSDGHSTGIYKLSSLLELAQKEQEVSL